MILKPEQRYTSDYRGRVQDKNVNITLEPMFALTYYEKMSDVKRSVNFHKYVEEPESLGCTSKASSYYEYGRLR